MSDLRPQVAEDDVTRLLAGLFGEQIHDLEPVEGGQVARTYSFRAGSGEFFLSVNRRLGANVEKLAFIERLLRPVDIPIPTIVHRGRLGKLYYAVTHRMPGTPLSGLDRSGLMSLAPSLMAMLDAIHAVDVGGSLGYGTIGDDGNGLFPSWRRYLENVYEEEEDWDFFGRWHVLFETTFLERDVFDEGYRQMSSLLPHCPEARHLIHGNIGFNNMLANDGAITAVLDWQDAGYGDPLYDVAQLDFWDPDGGWQERIRDRYRAHDRTMTGYDERIRCYQLHTVLNALRFFARKGDEGAYHWIRDRLRSLIEGAAEPS